ncbi:aldehyde dehydrogenase [Mycobacterium sp. ACS4331]|uniref:aldehyde dehydrogenase n=1 Tax=Mycobacterium sp. ACS4331 TaxID=1834121 RepID=UPI0007FC3EC6|nr:aldehyde dehydrogenase [Mycobacterium sp. ACS4331]OBF28002.1 aldehyde dehydrogenase PuuC [Mycobacterium sp. ACS4331]
MTATLMDNISATRDLISRVDCFIDGRFVPAQSGQRFPSVSPRDGQIIAEIAAGDTTDVDRAVRAARDAFADGRWARQHPRQRRAVLQRLARLVEEHKHELALLESWDMGKPVSDAIGVDMRVVVQSFDFFAEAIDKRYDEIGPSDPSVLSMITREPVGVVGAIVPWNFPLMLTAWKVAPALAMGNSVVLKPAELSSLTALRFAELAVEAGLPDGVFNVVPGFGQTAGSALARHNDVDLLCFTGSGPVGRQLLRDAADSNIKQVALELGGKSPQIVMPDAPDVDQVADGVAGGIFFNQGQICSAGSRLIVHRSRYDELVDAVVARTQNWLPGDPLDPATAQGAMVEERHLQRVLGHIDAARASGAEILTGGERAEVIPGGSYLQPTVITGAPEDSAAAQEEIFGPVLVVLPFDTTEEAVAIANGTPYGLAASVWTTDLSTAHTVSRDIRAGTVFVNCYDAADVSVPFGGYGQSGFGRDKSLHALEKYSQLKTTWIQL